MISKLQLNCPSSGQRFCLYWFITFNNLLEQKSLLGRKLLSIWMISFLFASDLEIIVSTIAWFFQMFDSGFFNKGKYYQKKTLKTKFAGHTRSFKTFVLIYLFTGIIHNTFFIIRKNFCVIINYYVHWRYT